MRAVAIGKTSRRFTIGWEIIRGHTRERREFRAPDPTESRVVDDDGNDDAPAKTEQRYSQAIPTGLLFEIFTCVV